MARIQATRGPQKQVPLAFINYGAVIWTVSQLAETLYNQRHLELGGGENTAHPLDQAQHITDN